MYYHTCYFIIVNDCFIIMVSDVNECDVDNGGCDHTCHNYLGGHYCSCRLNYNLKEDNKSCAFGK